MIRHVVIVGGGLAGSRCAQTLRADGFDGSITLVGDEPHLPYERPALSKEFLAGTREELRVQGPAAWTDLEIGLELGVPGGADRHYAPAREHLSRRPCVGCARSRDRSASPAGR
jgi:NADPH-dependent 2,4-dienoyl-CoA reductase/sulfur reductase-like enzyme